MTAETGPWAKRMFDPNDARSVNHSNHLIVTGGKTATRVWYPDTPLYESTTSQLLRDIWLSSHEKCGFIFGKELHEIIEVKNIHNAPGHNFRMDDTDTIETLDYIYRERSEEVIGIWHTHPNDIIWPSPRDIVGWPNPALNWRYWVVTHNDVYEWELQCP